MENEAGFTQEWASTSGERVERRQLEVQANRATNPTSEYRTVVSAVPDAAAHDFEEERKYTIASYCGLSVYSINFLN